MVNSHDSHRSYALLQINACVVVVKEMEYRGEENYCTCIVAVQLSKA